MIYKIRIISPQIVKNSRVIPSIFEQLAEKGRLRYIHMLKAIQCLDAQKDLAKCKPKLYPIESDLLTKVHEGLRIFGFLQGGSNLKGNPYYHFQDLSQKALSRLR